MPAHRVGAIGRVNGSEVQMFFETTARLVRCAVVTDDMGDEDNPVVAEIRLDELLNQYAEEINENTASIADHAAQLQLAAKDNYAVCNTAPNVAAKAVDISPFILDVGVEVTIKFANANTAPAVSLNVSNSGAKPIMYKNEPTPGEFLTGVQKFSYDGANWNVVGDFDKDTDTTYDVMSASEALAGTSVTPRTVNALGLNQTIAQISANIVNASLAGSYDVSGLQATLNSLIFQLAANGIIDGAGLDTIVTIDSPDDIVLVSGMYADGKVFI